MHVLELPADIEPVATSAHVRLIADALQRVLGSEKQFHYCEPVSGANRSGRLFSVKSSPTATPVTLTPIHAARELEKIGRTEARYADEPAPSGRDMRKGWEVVALEIDGSPAAIAWARWTAD